MPIRVDFWQGGSLREVGRDLARAPAASLAAFVPFDFRARLADNRQAVRSTYLSLLREVADTGTVTPAAEWLLDNHHVVDENFRHLRRDLEWKVYRALPVVGLAAGGSVPRVLALGWTFVAITNSEVSVTGLSEIVTGWQEVSALGIGEVWALPAVLRYVLLENLRRMADRIERSREKRQVANLLADRLALASLDAMPGLLEPHAADARDATFATQLLYRLRDGNEVSEVPLRWLERQMAVAGRTPDGVIAAEHAAQSSGNVTVGNIIRSLRLVDQIDWLAWFETVSRVDAILRESAGYASLDKHTRNTYRDTIERIARRSDRSEEEVARAAMAHSDAAEDPGAALVGTGLPDLEAACGYRPTLRERALLAYRRLGWLGIAVPSVAITIVLALAMARSLGVTASSEIAVLFALALLPASEAAVGLVNFAGARWLAPKRLPAHDYSAGVPETARTIVVIPCLLTSRDDIDDLIRNIELHYLSNPGGAVSFALLSDWVDHPTETRADDQMLLAHAREGIEGLAAAYANTGARRFFLLHRRRLYNRGEGVWMGWERKRGKLMELNQLLRDGHDTSFIDTGPLPPPGIRYVLTLDSDTRLPRGAVGTLVGKMAHPVNRAVIDPATGRITSGYGVLQPRVTPSLTTGDEASIFQRVFSTNRGLDPYVFTVSDLSQDLLGQGTFTGKGLYDIDAFDAAIAGRLPENSVLSHDLLEGALARTALVSDVQFVEDFPTRYLVDAARQHRWTRGDWQLVPFVLDLRNGLDGLARMKMIDNLRRSMVPILWAVAAVAGCVMLPAREALHWIGFLVLTQVATPVTLLMAGLSPGDPSVAQARHLRVVATEALGMLTGVGLRLSFLAHQAALMADAILRTAYRMTVSRTHLLEWRTASQVAAGTNSPSRYLREMAASPVIAVASVLPVALANPSALPVLAPLLLLWLAAPAIAWRTSQSLVSVDRLHIRPADSAALRRVARITWRYFEEFVTPASHHLPPDNFQDNPSPKVAERTSPTNIGMYLLSVLSARDFGWISLGTTLDRIEATLATVERLDKHRGHLFNWYDTATLAVLQPRYVSSVDSGNLAGHLIVVSSALKAWAHNSIALLPADPRGIGDVLGVLRQQVAAIPDDRRSLRPLRRRVEERIDGFEATYRTYLAEPQLASVRGINLSIIARGIHGLAQSLRTEAPSEAADNVVWWADALKSTCEAALADVASEASVIRAQQTRLNALAERARALAFAMDFGFLLNREKGLLSIGYRADPGQLDDSCYDLLASEARLASFFAIAKGDVPNDHWFRLGRPATVIGSVGTLLSWSGSMFEYLMPPLVMQERPGSILNQSSRAAVRRQIDDGNAKRVPWGVSESAFNARDRDMNYQYYAFGVASLGLKRTRADDLVIAPYAAALASQIDPAAAVANLERLAAIGALGRYGYFDAVDMTPSRLPDGSTRAVVRTLMAHHQGMVIVAAANAVLDGIHRDRFHDDPVVRAAELLLQEKAPREIVPITRASGVPGALDADRLLPKVAQTVVDDPASADRAIGLLSNGRYAKMITATGTGYSRLGDRAVTRWRPDPTTDSQGLFLFLRDTDSQAWWSATAAPKAAPDENAQTIFSEHKAEFRKTVDGLESHLEVIVASEADAEGYRLTLRNHGTRTRRIEVTSYGEIVLDRAEADQAHPAFSKLFVETAITRNGTTVTARRNARDPGGRPLFLAHLLCGSTEGRATQAETDRRAFIGRGRTLATAAAFDPGAVLAGGAGFTLDPILALRRVVKVAPGKSATVTFWTVIADSAEALDTAVAHYCNAATYDHEARLAWTRSQIQLRQLNISLEEAAVFRDVAALVLYPDLRLGAQDAEVRAVLGPQSMLWSMGLSGDHPIILIRIDTEADLPIVRTGLRMMEYFRSNGVLADLVILNERASSYTQDLQNALAAMCDAAARMAPPDAPRRVFTLRRDQLPTGQWQGLMAAARIVLHTQNGSIADHLSRLPPRPAPAAPPVRPTPATGRRRPDFGDETLEFWNGYGGFAADGRSYVVRLRHGERTPHPWINVIGRDDFGFHVSAEGAGFTWAVNSRDYQITPWSNDPVSNPPTEGLFLRDRSMGRVATPFAALSADPHAIYEARHGLGTSSFHSRADWIRVDAVQMLASDAPGKLTRVTVTNPGSLPLSLDCIAFADLVLGNNRAVSAPMIRTRFDRTLNAMLAQNPFSPEFPGRMTALACDRPVAAQTGSRADFLGGATDAASAVARAVPWQAGGGTASDGDPCLAISTRLDLPPGGSAEVSFLLADAPAAELPGVLRRVLVPEAAVRSSDAAQAEWSEVLGTLQVTTPDRRFDLMVNTWLPYQCLSCRIRARSAFYQASGAFGFRDQLQDTAALILYDPGLARAQILNAARRQFPEGDVQHWWLPATGAGVRTTISDDVVWLANCTARYVRLTGDRTLLDEVLPYIAGPPLAAGAHDAFYVPTEAGETATLYDHCVRALDLAIARTGARGLPLMLGGDWNDGMNRVGAGGQGESVWLGWFLAATLDDMAGLADARGDAGRAAAWRGHRQRLLMALDADGWDGAWYRRGFFDDGTPLGSAQADECRIDSIAQSWATIAGGGRADRAAAALDAALLHLRDDAGGLVRLFTPPFARTAQDPGYIKAYPPGVRENGGQYTHAVGWLIYALARAGRGNDAHAVFDLINPIRHAQSREAADHYRVEPYVVAADIYGAGEKTGRGGWTWYTGSAGWMYRAAVEGILGIVPEGGTHLRITPALPDDWPGYVAEVRMHGHRLRIEVARKDAETAVTVNGRGPDAEGRFAIAGDAA